MKLNLTSFVFSSINFNKIIKNKPMFNLKKLVKSFQYAGEGLVFVIKNEQNFRLEIIASVAILFGMYYFAIDWMKIILVSFGLFAILILEILNTIFEELTDFLVEEPCNAHKALISKEKICTGFNYRIKIIKDLAAGMVLLAGVFFIFASIAILWKI